MAFGRALRTQRYVIWALIIRELQVQRGPKKWAYINALIKPTITMCLFMGMRFFLNGGILPAEVMASLVVGFMMFFGFRSIATRCLVRIDTNRTIFFLPHIRPLDIILAESVVVWYIHMSAMVLFLGLIHLCIKPFEPPAWEYIVMGPILAGFFGLGLGLFLRSMVLFYPFLIQAVQAVFRILFWVSGVFFAPSMLPPDRQAYFALNPICICLEMTRYGIGSVYSPLLLNYTYVIVASSLLLVSGLLLCRHLWRTRRL